MIIYGWNSRNIKQAPLENYPCPQCQQTDSSHIVVVAKYVHIFWIPVFPYSKSAVAICTQCKHETHDEKAIFPGNASNIKRLKATVRLPLYLFSGLAIILLAIGYFTYAGAREDKLAESYVQEPQAGDVYLIRSYEEKSAYNHYLLKVRDVVGDSLWVSYSSYFYNGIISKLDPKDGFYDIMYPIHKDEIEGYRKSGELKKVMRGYDSSTGFNRDVEFPDSLANQIQELQDSLQ
ncbi:MAG: zinc-ribbon domain-containing protein [Cyclobacteriaceae bacterium]